VVYLDIWELRCYFLSSDPWSNLEEEILNCTKCRLHAYRRRAVPGEGNKNSAVVFIGEAPGEKEDEQGRPFVGPAGKLLTELIESTGYRREDFYITNIVKCRPPENRDPEEDEIEACLPYLMRQLELIKPKLIVCLGRHSARTIFRLAGLKWTSMTSQHGRVYSARLLGFSIKIIPTYHPAAALYNPQLRSALEEDFKKTIKSIVAEITEARPAKKTLLDYSTGRARSST
jgi:DNA polymerase